MRIGIDVDLTVVDTLTPWLNWFKQKTGKELSIDNISGYSLDPVMQPFMPSGILPSDYWEQEDLYNHLEPLPEAIKFVNKALEMGHEVVFITLSTSGHHGSKEAFLRKYFGSCSGVIHTKLKYMIDVDAFIDDNVSVAKEMTKYKPSVKTYLHKTLLNQNNKEMRPMTWEEISESLYMNI